MISSAAPQAEDALSNEDTRKTLDEIILHARRTLFKTLFDPPLPPTTTDYASDLPPDWRSKVLKETRDILIDQEVQRRKAIKMTMANEGLEAAKKEEELQSKKRKKDADKAWEGSSLYSLLAFLSGLTL